MSDPMEAFRVMKAPSTLGVSVQLRPSVNDTLVEPPLLLAKTV